MERRSWESSPISLLTSLSSSFSSSNNLLNSLPSSSPNKLLTSLPTELLVMLASYLDVSSYLAFASSSTNFLDILISKHQWKTLMQKTRMSDDRIELKPARPKGWLDMSKLKKYNKEDLKDMEEEVKKLAVFLKFAKKAKKQEGNKTKSQEGKKPRWQSSA